MEKRTIRPVRLGGVVLGEGRPKVCVPVMGESIAAFGRSAAQAARAGAEVIELRIDSLNAMPSAQEAIAACRAVREAAGDIPILFTLRTARDGGPGSADAAAYAALLAEVAQTGVCEAIDVELSVGNAAFARLVRAAHAGGAAVVGSSHEFGEIADIRLAGEWLRRQRALGADVCKAAIMPRDDEQALELALDMLRASKALDAPCICIVMGRSGVLTRVCAQMLGSCLTFGAAGRASAPGQMDAAALKGILSALDASLRI